jgi:hypothetical protein
MTQRADRFVALWSPRDDVHPSVIASLRNEGAAIFAREVQKQIASPWRVRDDERRADGFVPNACLQQLGSP